jgi:hypothetical protein
MKLSRIGFLSAVAVLAPFAFYGASVTVDTLRSDHGALVMGAPQIPSFPTLEEWTQGQEQKGFALSPKARSAPASRQVPVSPYGGLVTFTSDQQASDPLIDLLRDRFDSRKIVVVSLPPNGEG